MQTYDDDESIRGDVGIFIIQKCKFTENETDDEAKKKKYSGIKGQNICVKEE